MSTPPTETRAAGARALAAETFDAELEPREAHGCRVTVLAPRLADGTTSARPSLLLPSPPRLVAGGAARDATVTFALEDPELPEPLENDGRPRRVTARILLARGTSCYGTGEVVGPLERTGHAATLWNTDAHWYGEKTRALYQSHPYVLLVHADGSARGVLADSFRPGTIEIGRDAVELAFEEEPFDLYLIDGPDPAAVTRALASLVGRIAMPPLWALGYHQCRWSYMSAEEVRALAAEFRRRGIPCDGIWLDIDYMDRFRVFTVDERAFPDLAGLTDELRGRGFRTVAILDPGVAVDSELAREGLERGAFVLDASGAPAKGDVWPGTCHFPDFTAAATRAWWSEHVRAFVEGTGLDGLWNDMNEPSVRNGPGRTLPRDCTHVGLDGSGGDHARWHNLYGQLMVAASHAGFVAARPERRPFLLTRSNHVTGSRLAATWTGDNQAKWEHLRWSIPMALSLGLSGQPFSGPDVGGFDGDPDAELFVRWFELACLLPFFRGHAERTTCRKEPWSFGPEAEAHVRAAIERRMKLLPTLYTLFRRAVETGEPIARPLLFADPADPALRTVDDQFLLGEDLLVAPVVHPGASDRRVLFPAHAGGWFPFYALPTLRPLPRSPAEEEEHRGGAEDEGALRRKKEERSGGEPIHDRESVVAAPLGTLPLFARAGAILFEHEPRPSTATPPALLVVHVFPGPDGRASGRLYEDEGDGHAHERGVYRDARFTATVTSEGVVIDEEASGDFDSPAVERCFVVHAGGAPRIATRRRARRYEL